jgi:hypothetical protein
MEVSTKSGREVLANNEDCFRDAQNTDLRNERKIELNAPKRTIFRLGECMKLPRIYLDTSIFGGCFEQEFAEWSIGLLIDIKNGLFRATTSEIVALEINAGAPANVKQKFGEHLIHSPREITSYGKN